VQIRIHYVALDRAGPHDGDLDHPISQRSLGDDETADMLGEMAGKADRLDGQLNCEPDALGFQGESGFRQLCRIDGRDAEAAADRGIGGRAAAPAEDVLASTGSTGNSASPIASPGLPL